MAQGKIPTKTVLGIPIAALRLKEISSVVVSLIEENGRKKTFFYVDAHHFNIANKDSGYKKILQKATFVHASGMGPILASRILNSPLPERTPAPDFIQQVFAVAERRGWSFYLLGGEDGVAKMAAERMQKRFPRLKIAGYHHGFFTPHRSGAGQAKDSVVIEKINQAKPDIVLVGMGPPKQEKWIEENKDKIEAGVFWAVGALFDILSGRRKRAPIWMQRLGFEWVFRLWQEPRRLWKRYAFGNIVFLFTVLREKGAFSRRSSR